MLGALLRAFREFFPNADLVGCDIDSRILFKRSSRSNIRG